MSLWHIHTNTTFCHTLTTLFVSHKSVAGCSGVVYFCLPFSWVHCKECNTQRAFYFLVYLDCWKLLWNSCMHFRLKYTHNRCVRVCDIGRRKKSNINYVSNWTLTELKTRYKCLRKKSRRLLRLSIGAYIFYLWLGHVLWCFFLTCRDSCDVNLSRLFFPVCVCVFHNFCTHIRLSHIMRANRTAQQQQKIQWKSTQSSCLTAIICLNILVVYASQINTLSICSCFWIHM